MGVQEHRAAAIHRVRFGIISLSDSRTPKEDLSGDKAQGYILEAGHSIVSRLLIKDDPETLRWSLRALAGNADTALLIGGTGLSLRDRTYETLKPLYSKEIHGFGELFRRLSANEIAQAAILSRASAGLFMDLLVVSLPGSPKAIELGLKEILLPEVGHIVFEMRKPGGP